MSAALAPFRPRAARRPSLVRRLVWLAAVWSLLALLAAGVALTAFFLHSSLSRFEQSLNEIVVGLYAGTTVQAGDKGPEVAAPPFTDERATRAYSGRYWEIAEAAGPDGLQALQRSRSLWDGELKAPPGARADTFKLGTTVHYDSVGPAGERLRVQASTRTLPGWPRPLVFMAAEDRGPVKLQY